MNKVVSIMTWPFRKVGGASVNTLETIMLNFLKNEMVKNPQLAGALLQEVLAKTKLDPTLQADLVALLDQLLPIIISKL